jgi:hypothetical protein
MNTLDRFLENHPAVNREGTQEMTRAIWGGIAQEYDLLKEQIKIVSSDSAILENIKGDMLDELVIRFIGTQRVTDEGDESRLKTLYALFRRAGQLSWETKHAIRGAFSYYFPIETINILENAIETNIVQGGDFEEFEAGVKTTTFGSWTPTGTSIEIEISEAYHGVKSVRGTGTGSVSQTVSALSGTNIITFAYRGALTVKIQRASDNYYWNFTTKTWIATEVGLNVNNTNTRYELIEKPVFLDINDSLIITFSLNSVIGTEYRIDVVSFGPKPSYPFIRVLVTTGGTDGDYMNNWPGSVDPVSGADYNNATFLGIDYIGGDGGGIPATFYQVILDYIKASGVKAVFEFIGRG